MSRSIAGMTKFIAVALTLMLSQTAVSYAPIEETWPTGRVSFRIADIGEEWLDAMKEAVARWQDTPVAIAIETVDEGSSQSCDLDGVNGIWWSESDCGEEGFGSTTLAVTNYWYRGDEIVEADIIFNSNESWAIYNGRLQGAVDFQRVAVHELGHAFGASHSEQNEALMFPTVSSTHVAQVDDINALGAGGDYGWDRNYNLNLSVSGSGRISVQPQIEGTLRVDGQALQSDYSALSCSDRCRHPLQKELRLVVVAEPESGQTFTGWEGTSCRSNGCILSPLTFSRELTANFSGQGSKLPPLAPRTLAASDGNFTNRVRVAWTASEGAYKYRIQRALAGSERYTLIGQTRGLAIVDRNPVSGVAYQYRVKACGAPKGDCGSFSASDSGYASDSVLPGPTDFSAADGSSPNGVRVQWNAVAGAYNYRVERASSRNGSYTLIGELRATAFMDRGGSAGREYFYRARACASRNGDCGQYSVTDSGYRGE